MAPTSFQKNDLDVDMRPQQKMKWLAPKISLMKSHDTSVGKLGTRTEGKGFTTQGNLHYGVS
jgi:hypothetical protein